MLKLLSFVLAIFFISGCSSKEFYTIGDISKVKRGVINQKEFIGVEQIKVPAYLMTSPIYIKMGNYHLKKLENANWVDSMDEHLTSVLIAYLQKYMDNPNIYLYPWSGIRHIDKKLNLIINEFIISDGTVILNARYRILDKRSNRVDSFSFDIKERVEGHSVDDMMMSMEKAYFKLINDISKNL